MFQAGVGAASGRCDVHPGRGLRLPLESHLADGHRAAGLGAALEQRLLDTEPGEAVTEVADRLVVVEVGLGHPALRAAAANHETTGVVGVGRDGEAAVVDRHRPDHRPPRHHRRQRVLVGGHHPPQREGQLAQTFPGHGGHLEHRPAALLDVGAHEVGELSRLGHVDLVEHHRTGPVREVAERGVALQSRPVGRQLGLQRVNVRYRVATGFHCGAIDHVDENRAALDVTEKVQAQPATGGCAGDQAGHVGDGEGVLPGRHHAEVGDQRGERVVSDLRLGRRDRRHERGFARRGEADQPHVGDGFQLQGEGALLPLLTQQRETRGLAGAGRQRSVAQAAAAALRGGEAGARTDQIGQQPAVVVEHHGAVGNPDLEIGPGGSVAVAARTLLARGRHHMRVEMEVQQRVHLRVDDQNHAAAASTVAAVGAAKWFELLAMDRRAAVAPVTRAGVDDDAVDEPGHRRVLSIVECAPTARNRSQSRSGCTLAKLRPTPVAGRGRC